MPVCDKTSVSSPLEDLPPEIRLQILCNLELEALNALVHATPIFHQLYLRHRRLILCKCLENSLCSVSVDALAVHRSSLADFLETRTYEKVVGFLQSYHDQRSVNHFSIPTEHMTEEKILNMVTFHSSVIKPLARLYAQLALAIIASESQKSESLESLSKSEQTRLLRSLYRFQLCCNLFGLGNPKISWKIGRSYDSVEILRSFLCLFEPWEVEEIACIYTFAEKKYDEIFRDIHWDVHEKNAKFDGQRPPTPEGAFDLDNSWTRDSLLKGTISRGLELLYIVFFGIRDHKHLVSTMQKHISWPQGGFLGFLGNEALGEGAQYHRRRQLPSYRDKKQEQREPMFFRGDGEDDADGPRPPLAWTLMWGGTYSNLYGYYVSDDIRRWGYVFWDSQRLERTGAKEVLARQWEEYWDGSDPRDELY